MSRRADFYASGQWNFYCDFCGAKRKSSDGVRSWQGNRICKEHREVRNPQDFLKGIKDNQTVPWSRPQAVEFVQSCTIEGSTAIPLLAIPGCMTPGKPYHDGPQPFCTNLTSQARADIGAANCATVGRIA